MLWALLTVLISVGCSKSDEQVLNPAPQKPVDQPVGEDFGDLGEEEQTEESEETDQTDNSGTVVINTEEEELPTRPVPQEDVPEEEINPTRIVPGEPCYKFMDDQVAKPVANCSRLMSGLVDDSYPEIVKFSRICLLKSEYNNGITVFTATGSFTQTDDDWNRTVYPLYGFKKTNIKDDKVKFSFKDDGLKTEVKYDIVDEVLYVKQRTKSFRKKVRYFKLGCTPVFNIR